MTETKKRLSVAKIKKRRIQLRLLYGIEKSWRVVQKDYYPEVTFQTLQAFADRKRNYVPASDAARAALDLYADPNPYKIMPKWWKREPHALDAFNKTRASITKMFEDAKRQRSMR